MDWVLDMPAIQIHHRDRAKNKETNQTKKPQENPLTCQRTRKEEPQYVPQGGPGEWFKLWAAVKPQGVPTPSHNWGISRWLGGQFDPPVATKPWTVPVYSTAGTWAGDPSTHSSSCHKALCPHAVHLMTRRPGPVASAPHPHPQEIFSNSRWCREATSSSQNNSRMDWAGAPSAPEQQSRPD